jgi:hypothetical protein
VPCLVETLEAFAVFIAGTDIVVKADGRRRGRTHHLREPAPGGRAPIGPAGVTESVPEHTGVEAPLGGFELTDGIVTRPGEITHRFIGHGGDLHGRESP